MQHCRRSVCEKCGSEWRGKACKKVNKSEQKIEQHRERNRCIRLEKEQERMNMRLWSVKRVIGSVRQKEKKYD